MMELLIALKWPLIILQALFSLVLIIMVLLQTGKGDDMGSALSGQMGGGVQGSGGTSKVLVKGTAIFAILFMVNSIVLAKIFKEISSTSIGTSVTDPLLPSTNSATAPNAVGGNTVVADPVAPNAVAPATKSK